MGNSRFSTLKNLADKLGIPWKDLLRDLKDVVVEMDEEDFFDGNGEQ